MAESLTKAESLGASLQANGVHFKVWAPQCRQVDVCVEGHRQAYALTQEPSGYFSADIDGLKEGCLYKYRIDGKNCFPDPASRFQPQGPHGPSMVIDQKAYPWGDGAWQKKGLGAMRGQVIYELHVGTFSPEGTYAGLKKHLSYFKELGVTAIELMPLAEFAGRWNWGYDGVDFFAPSHCYGTPDDLKSFIDAAHQMELGVLLDVVYNHFGPDGNYLKQFSSQYFTERYKNEWGEPINFDGPGSDEVRHFFIENACYWIKDFHFDGLRFDAVETIHDSSRMHVLAEICDQVRIRADGKSVLLIGENESQDLRFIRPKIQGGLGMDALWNDDFHHTCKVAATGRREAYYMDYLAKPQDFVSLIKYGYLYQGQYYSWQHKERGTYVDEAIKSEQFVIFLENHDQVANSLKGQRLIELTDRDIYRALTAYFLLSPFTPMLFMGQEFGATTAFNYFTDHHPELGKLVSKGRIDFLSQFSSIEAAKELILDPQNPQTFKQSKLNLSQRVEKKDIYQLYVDLLKMRRVDAVFNRQDRRLIDGAVLGDSSFLLRYKGVHSDRLLMVNLGAEFNSTPCPLPLLAPLEGKSWEMLWSSEDLRYGGNGIVNAYEGKCWNIPGRCALIYSC